MLLTEFLLPGQFSYLFYRISVVVEKVYGDAVFCGQPSMYSSSTRCPPSVRNCSGRTVSAFAGRAQNAPAEADSHPGEPCRLMFRRFKFGSQQAKNTSRTTSLASDSSITMQGRYGDCCFMPCEKASKSSARDLNDTGPPLLYTRQAGKRLQYSKIFRKMSTR